MSSANRRTRARSLALLLAGAACSIGCASSYQAPLTPAQAQATAGAPPAQPQEKQALSNLYLLGFFGALRTDVRDMCPSGVATQISIRTTWFTTLITVATLGLYSPLEQRFVCAPRPVEPT